MPEVEVTPYVVEWDLANETVVAQWAPPHLGTYRSLFAGIDFDGENLWVLSEWDENELRPDDKPRPYCRLDVLDKTMRSTRNARVPCGGDVAVARAGRSVIVSYQPIAQTEASMTIRLLDARQHVRRTATFRVAGLDISGPNPVIHAGDSFYALVDGAEDMERIVRLDDETLRVRGHSQALSGQYGQASFSKSDDGWVVSWGMERWTVSPLLDRATVHQEDFGFPAPEAWHGTRVLSSTSMPPGSYVHGTCAPRWAFGTPLFACASNEELAIVRPALEDVRQTKGDDAAVVRADGD